MWDLTINIWKIMLISQKMTSIPKIIKVVYLEGLIKKNRTKASFIILSEMGN